MGAQDLQGVFGIVPTPLRDDHSLDESGLAHLAEHCRDSKLHGAVVLGSNSEFPYFTFDEKLRIIKAARDGAQNGIHLVAGVSAFGTTESVALAKAAKEAGFAAVLAALPLYFDVPFEMVKYHFNTLAREGGLPVLFYYWPEITGLELSPDQISEIAAIENIDGAKLSVLNRGFFKKVVNLTRPRLWSVFIGSSLLLRYALKRGGAGCFCPLPLIAPGLCLEIHDAMQEGDTDKAVEAEDRLLGALPLFSGVDSEGTMASTVFKAMARKPYTGPGERPEFKVGMLKEALRLQGHPISSAVRSPCPPLTEEQAVLTRQVLEKLGWI